MGINKKFSQELYDKHDSPAKYAVLNYVQSHGLYVRVNDDMYGPDLVVYTGFRPGYHIEVEQRSGWETGPFPPAWDPIHIPGRKKKFLDMRLPLEVWIVSSALTDAIVVPESSITENRLAEFSNSMVKQGELFYHIPLTECIHIELGDSNEET